MIGEQANIDDDSQIFFPGGRKLIEQ
jgi:hypothetical protein